MNIFEKQKFESLQAMIYWLDGLKVLWYQAELAKNLNHNLFAAAKRLQAELDAIPKFGTLPDWMKMPEVIPDSLEAYPKLPEDHSLAGEVHAFMDESTDDYPWWISFGAFWNEIENPECVNSLVEQLGAFYAAKPETGCLGSERAFSGECQDGYAALSYYDIGSEFLIFKDEEHARAFDDADPVDPVSVYRFSGGGWFCE